MEEKKKSNVGLIVLVVILLLACVGMGAFFFVTNNTIETRSCIGTYSGQGVVTQDARTGEKTNGTITVELKEEGTYKLTKSGMDQYWTGHYTIIENALLLKEGPSTCDQGADCSEKYSSFLSIADDCSKITGGYGSVFFDSNFTLTKNN